MQTSDDFERSLRLRLDHPWPYRLSSHINILSSLKVNQSSYKKGSPVAYACNVYTNPGGHRKSSKRNKSQGTVTKDHYVFLGSRNPYITILTFTFQ